MSLLTIKLSYKYTVRHHKATPLQNLESNNDRKRLKKGSNMRYF